MRLNSMTIDLSKAPPVGGQTERLSVSVVDWLAKVFASCRKLARLEPFTSKVATLTYWYAHKFTQSKMSQLGVVRTARGCPDSGRFLVSRFLPSFAVSTLGRERWSVRLLRNSYEERLLS
jgi:hypothetical protein